ncbi:MAG: hypothetical protein ACPGU1_20070 [Myxococcota bacterium]
MIALPRCLALLSLALLFAQPAAAETGPEGAPPTAETPHAEDSATAIPADAGSEVAETGARVLVRDLRRVVTLSEKTGWGIDHYEYEAMLPSALESVCRTPAAGRLLAERILTEAADELGGDPAMRLVEPGVTLSDISELLSASRTAELLRQAIAEQERCPFWMKSRDDFRGLHSDEGRVSLHFEGGGAVIGRFLDGELTFGVGGGGRLAVGYGFAESWDVRGGLGFGGGALADETVSAENIEADFYIDVPVIIRHTGVLWRQELEVAGIVHGIPWKDPMQFGMRFGGLIGFGYLRVQEFMPWVGLGVYAEYSFARDGMPELWTLRAGVRVGISWASLGD